MLASCFGLNVLSAQNLVGNFERTLVAFDMTEIAIVDRHRRGFFECSVPRLPQPLHLALGCGATERHVPQRSHPRSEEYTSELQSLTRNSYSVFCFTPKTILPHTYLSSI